jgi:lysophospholipase L1-like esterase
VNNSWSGGNLSGVDNEDSGVNRVHHLSNNSGDDPDIILVFMGINDMGRGVNVGAFSADYECVLQTIKNKYPSAKVCCVNLPDRDPVIKSRTKSFNTAIEDAVKNAGDNFFIADLFNSRLNNDFYYMNTVDGLHPDEDGMKHIADIIEDAIRKHMQ